MDRTLGSDVDINNRTYNFYGDTSLKSVTYNTENKMGR
jgi:hypothetical protein